MRRTRIVGCGVALACVLVAIGATGASSASAALPELGRCVKVSGTGEFTRENCVAVSKTHTGSYEWAPGPGAMPGVNIRFFNPTLQTVTGNKIKCAFVFLEESQFTSDKEFKVKKVTMQSCIMVGSNLPCFSSPTEPGTIESTTPLKGELGFIPGSKTAVPFAGWDLKAESESSPIVEFFCGENNAVPIYQVVLQGSVIGHVVKTNKMQTTFGLKYKQSAGIQIPEAFIGGEKDTLTQLTTPLSNPGAKKTEQVGLASVAEMIPSEALEIKVKV
jgi:hypothetical protein